MRRCQAHDLSRYVRWRIRGQIAGYVLPAVARFLGSQPSFQWSEGALDLVPPSHTERSHALARAVGHEMAAGYVPRLHGELYPVQAHYRGPELACVDRAAAPMLGIQTYGVHLNAWSVSPDTGEMMLWVAQRSQAASFPGQLDHLVAGGHQLGRTATETLLNEASEEAGLPKEMLAARTFEGSRSYRMDTRIGLVDSYVQVFDAELPWEFKPSNQDGKIDGFERLSLLRVARLISDGAFKFNCALVVTDFLLRRQAFAAVPEQERNVLAQLLDRRDPRLADREEAESG